MLRLLAEESYFEDVTFTFFVKIKTTNTDHLSIIKRLCKFQNFFSKIFFVIIYWVFLSNRCLPLYVVVSFCWYINTSFCLTELWNVIKFLIFFFYILIFNKTLHCFFKKILNICDFPFKFLFVLLSLLSLYVAALWLCVKISKSFPLLCLARCWLMLYIPLSSLAIRCQWFWVGIQHFVVVKFVKPTQETCYIRCDFLTVHWELLTLSWSFMFLKTLCLLSLQHHVLADHSLA